MTLWEVIVSLWIWSVCAITSLSAWQGVLDQQSEVGRQTLMDDCLYEVAEELSIAPQHSSIPQEYMFVSDRVVCTVEVEWHGDYWLLHAHSGELATMAETTMVVPADSPNSTPNSKTNSTPPST